MRAYSDIARKQAKKIAEDQDKKTKEEDASNEASRSRCRKKKTTFSNRQVYPTIRSAAATPERQVSESGYRFLDPGLGRFVGRDLLEELGGINQYCFVQNNVINDYDANGLAAANAADGWEDRPPLAPSLMCCLWSWKNTWGMVKDDKDGCWGEITVNFTVRDEDPATTPKDRLCCRCNCCYYRQKVRGFYRKKKNGPKFYDGGSFGMGLVSIKDWVEEAAANAVSLLHSNNDWCKRKFVDHPGWHAPLPQGKYIELQLEFEIGLWDECQGRWIVGPLPGKLYAEGDSPPRDEFTGIEMQIGGYPAP